MTTPLEKKQLELLYKKNFGIPYGKPGDALTGEVASDSRARIIPGVQLFSQEIPIPAPTDLTEVTGVFSAGDGIKKVSTSKGYIAKYEFVKLKGIAPGRSYTAYVTDGVASTNRLKNTIPFNSILVFLML